MKPKTLKSTPSQFLAIILCLALTLMAVGPMTPVMAAGGDVITNGTPTQPNHIDPGSEAAAGIPGNFFPSPFAGFLFEPENPYETLKAVPIWNEIEQLLDNPYAVAYDPNTPNNDHGYPSYRSRIVRRPGFQTPGSNLNSPGPALPQFLMHPLNYHPGTGEEMRLLNPFYPGGSFDVPDKLYQDLAYDPGGNTWRWSYKTVDVTPGWERVEETEIDHNSPIAADDDVCILPWIHIGGILTL